MGFYEIIKLITSLHFLAVAYTVTAVFMYVQESRVRKYIARVTEHIFRRILKARIIEHDFSPNKHKPS